MAILIARLAGRASLVILSGVSLLALVYQLMVGIKPGSAPLPEALRSSLELREGRLYRRGDQIPYTGNMLELYETGALKSRSSISNGLLHGLSQGWHTNGLLQISEWFQSGISHGLRTKWHVNGQKLSETHILYGQVHGLFRRWTDQGVLAEEMEMVHGHPEGISRSYYPSGFMKAEARLHLGQVTERHFWKEGEKQSPSACAQAAAH